MRDNRYFLVHAVRGPVLLITVGVLFAVHQAGILRLGRTWPLILIVLGVMKLLERTVAPAWPYAPPSPYGQPPYPGAPHPGGAYAPPAPPPPPYSGAAPYQTGATPFAPRPFPQQPQQTPPPPASEGPRA